MISVRGSNVIPVASELVDDPPTNLVAEMDREAGWIRKNIADRDGSGVDRIAYEDLGIAEGLTAGRTEGEFGIREKT